MLRAFWTFRHLGSALLALAVVGCGGDSSRDTGRAVRIRFATGIAGGTFRGIGDALARDFRRVVPEIEVSVLDDSSGAIANLVALQEGKADIALSFSDVAYLAAMGELPEQPRHFSGVAAIALLQPSALHVVLPHDSTAKTLDDLIGRRLGVAGANSTGSANTARLALDSVGSHTGDPTTWVPLGFQSASAQLRDGSLDAYFQMAAPPIDWINAALTDGARLLPLTDNQIRELVSRYPFFKPMSIRASYYAGLQHSVSTIGVEAMLVCRTDLDPAVVYRLTKALFDPKSIDFASVAKNHLVAAESAGVPIPLHPGASRFYREQFMSSR
jgi:uncharacterized protein